MDRQTAENLRTEIERLEALLRGELVDGKAMGAPGLERIWVEQQLRYRRQMFMSAGHICFSGDFEYFQSGDQVYRAALANPIMTDGRRAGRWECPASQWPTRAKILGLQEVA